MTDIYPTLKFIHIISSTVLFGTGLGTAFFMWRADRSGDTAAFAVVTRNVVLADWAFTTPVAIIQPLSGFALIYWVGFPLNAPWIVFSLILYLIVIACWLPVVWIQCRVARWAADCAVHGNADPVERKRLMRWWYALGWPAGPSVVAIFYLMVFKPALW